MAKAKLFLLLLIIGQLSALRPSLSEKGVKLAADYEYLTRKISSVQDAVPSVPSLNLPSLPGLPTLPSLPTFPSLPSLPSIPVIDYTEVGITDVISAIAQTNTAGTGRVLNLNADTAAQLASTLAACRDALGAASDSFAANPLLAAPLIQIGLFALVAAGASRQQLPPEIFDPTYGDIYTTSGKYNPQDAERYFGARPVLTAMRALELAAASASFGSAILLDLVTGQINDFERESERAAQLTSLLTKLGPTFIKVGQSLSIRTDLLRPAYLNALAQLQDSVPAFSTEEAVRIIEDELTRSVRSVDGNSREGKGKGKARVSISDVFSGLSAVSQPVAAASLGQVYKAVLKESGLAVAVKVQRPNIEERVALDMHLLRGIVQPVKKLFSLQSDVLGIVDDWGFGFVSELNYLQEARNSQNFMQSIALTPLKDAVFAPEVISEATSKRVLTTRWIDGERLELSNPSDRSAMCRLAMNAYLTMMLETPVLHADPHPGNLRRTPDGRLCILDWGLVTSLNPDLQVTMIDHISHLVSKDYARVPGDLVKLGFIPPGMELAAKEGGVVEVLSDVYGKWATGGGAAKIDINAVVQDLSGLTERYGNLFQLPPYFAYIAKAFGVLEGIGLTNDKDYAIVGECLPYIAKRLLSKADDKTEASLRSFIYGPAAASDGIVDADRLELLVRGFDNYGANKGKIGGASMAMIPAMAADSGSLGGRASTDIKSNANGALVAKQIEDVAESLVQLLLEGPSDGPAHMDSATYSYAPTPLQKILVEELVRYLSASTRLAGSRIREMSGRLPGSNRTVLGLLVDPLGLFTTSRLVEPDDHDFRAVKAAEKVAGLFIEMLSDRDNKAIIPKVVQRGGLTTTTTSAASVTTVSAPAVDTSASVRQQLATLLTSLSPQQTAEVVMHVARKVYERREGVRGLGMLFGRTLLQQVAGRARA